MPLRNCLPFDSADPLASLQGLPQAAGVFALYGAERPGEAAAEPYLSKTPNLRRRLMRFLRDGGTGGTGPQTGPQTRRLRLAHMVHRIEYSVTGSEFESSLCLYEASVAAFGNRGRSRLRLRPPAFLRMSLDNPYPRVYATARIGKSASKALFGPFPSRAAAERYGEEMLNLFLLRRCTDDLNPDPAFPGCPYSEMKMCLAPCFKGCTDERYAQESADVLAFLSTRGASLMAKLEAERDRASEGLEFEQAQALHQRMQKVQAVTHLASEAVRPLADLSGIVVQPAAEPGEVALYQLRSGFLSGPALYSTAGMRLANERSGSSSLFAQPVAIEAIPLDIPERAQAADHLSTKDVLESRLDEALMRLAKSAPKPASSQVLADHLALFTRWFYRPAARRVGEIVFMESKTEGGGEVSRKALLRAISRVAVRAASEERAQMDQAPLIH